MHSKGWRVGRVGRVSERKKEWWKIYTKGDGYRMIRTVLREGVHIGRLGRLRQREEMTKRLTKCKVWCDRTAVRVNSYVTGRKKSDSIPTGENKSPSYSLSLTLFLSLSIYLSIYLSLYPSFSHKLFLRWSVFKKNNPPLFPPLHPFFPSQPFPSTHNTKPHTHQTCS